MLSFNSKIQTNNSKNQLTQLETWWELNTNQMIFRIKIMILEQNLMKVSTYTLGEDGQNPKFLLKELNTALIKKESRWMDRQLFCLVLWERANLEHRVIGRVIDLQVNYEWLYINYLIITKI